MRAYHRVDPLMDERKGHYSPAQFGAFLKVQLVAGRQKDPGYFHSAAGLRSMLPSAYARHIDFLIAQGDLIQKDGRLYVDGWTEWQEGDLTVNERMARLRNRHRNHGVTGTVTPPSPAAFPPLSPQTPLSPPRTSVGAGEPAVTDERFDAPETEAVAWLAKHGVSLSETNGIRRKLIGLVERFGSNAVIGKFDRLVHAGVLDGDGRGFVFGAEDALFPKPNLKGLEAAERADETHRASDARYQATQAELRRMRGEN